MEKTAKSRFWSLVPSLALLLLFSAPAMAQMIGAPVPEEIGFQPGASPTKEMMINFHNGLLLPIITAITLFVFFLLIFVMVRFNARANPVPSKTTHNTMLEVVWTLVPVLILVIVVVPSMKILYYVDRTHEADMTLKVTGNQWYWSYEYPDHGGFTFNANLVPEEKIDAKKGQIRLLSTDNPVVLPIDTNIRILVTASDVLHSWAVPAFGVKMDGNPGKLNETWVRIDKPGTFYGQCSELCGQGHGFMPIEVHAVTMPEFAKWVHAQGGKMPDELAAAKGAASAAEAKPAPLAAPKAAKPQKEKEKSGAK